RTGRRRTLRSSRSTGQARSRRWAPSRGTGCPARRRRRSLADARHRNVEPDDPENGLAGDCPLTERDPRSGARGEVDVDAAAEADQPNALSGFDDVALANECYDAASDQSRDLGEPDPQPVRTFDQQILALIVFARF